MLFHQQDIRVLLLWWILVTLGSTDPCGSLELVVEGVLGRLSVCSRLEVMRPNSHGNISALLRFSADLLEERAPALAMRVHFASLLVGSFLQLEHPFLEAWPEQLGQLAGLNEVPARRGSAPVKPCNRRLLLGFCSLFGSYGWT